ncbi:hypothetical protein RCL_jg22803.t2 [Rhizophagus clarus]|uniref:Uncharacterized protein n=1 Tax=Rhizophagus clarus TaxID=94130 RepID=A0A8H3QLT4_9GLOM|nr:hypothetical protein RCL_jg22803.t2 [Rhizophagus clarus]
MTRQHKKKTPLYLKYFDYKISRNDENFTFYEMKSSKYVMRRKKNGEIKNLGWSDIDTTKNANIQQLITKFGKFVAHEDKVIAIMAKSISAIEFDLDDPLLSAVIDYDHLKLKHPNIIKQVEEEDCNNFIKYELEFENKDLPININTLIEWITKITKTRDLTGSYMRSLNYSKLCFRRSIKIPIFVQELALLAFKAGADILAQLNPLKV